MTEHTLGFSVEALTLPNEDAGENARIFQEWTAAFPTSDPIVKGLVLQAVIAWIEIRRLERILATVRTEKVRMAVLAWERHQDDIVDRDLEQFNVDPGLAQVNLLRTASGCRWALDYLEKLQKLLTEDGTWYAEDRLGAIQIQGLNACLDKLKFSPEAYVTWIDCLATRPNPSQRDIDTILDPANIPKTLQERGVPLWPRDPVECRARMQAILDRELPEIRALEETLRVEYEDPSRAEAETMALADVTRQEMQLLGAQRMHQQSYLQASTALAKFRKQAQAPRGPVPDPPLHSARLIAPRIVPAPVASVASAATPRKEDWSAVGHSEHRVPGHRAARAGRPRRGPYRAPPVGVIVCRFCKRFVDSMLNRGYNLNTDPGRSRPRDDDVSRSARPA